MTTNYHQKRVSRLVGRFPDSVFYADDDTCDGCPINIVSDKECVFRVERIIINQSRVHLGPNVPQREKNECADA